MCWCVFARVLERESHFVFNAEMLCENDPPLSAKHRKHRMREKPVHRRMKHERTSTLACRIDVFWYKLHAAPHEMLPCSLYYWARPSEI